jgi:hypothetical protein
VNKVGGRRDRFICLLGPGRESDFTSDAFAQLIL